MKKLIMTALCCVAAVSVASAHAFLDHASPAVGSTLKESPKEVRIWFTEGLVLPFSNVWAAGWWRR